MYKLIVETVYYTASVPRNPECRRAFESCFAARSDPMTSTQLFELAPRTTDIENPVEWYCL